MAGHRFRHTWAMPLLLAVLLSAGLLAALVGEHPAWRWLAWGCVGVPLAMGGWKAAGGLRRSR